jgi:hypothetical protein
MSLQGLASADPSRVLIIGLAPLLIRDGGSFGRPALCLGPIRGDVEPRRQEVSPMPSSDVWDVLRGQQGRGDERGALQPSTMVFFFTSAGECFANKFTCSIQS